MSLKDFFTLVISIAITAGAGFVGSLFTTPAIPIWYAELVKPALNPPSFVFGPVWGILYILMGISLFLIWKKHSNILQNIRMLQIWKWGVGVFFLQLVLNTLWSILFFGLQSPALALLDTVLLWLSILITIILFYKLSRLAAYLLVPYILWVSFAVYLNYLIVMLN
ncbi:MAG: tryptophan-rich sensory protein [Parcubacteria group bacterium]|nr:tryptophan-rich sensory protein [Parcubacteria group bacterium]